MREPMTSEEYINLLGVCCPVCKVDAVQGHDMDTCEGMIYQNVTCNNCEASWVDHYQLMGYGELEI